MDSKYLFFFCRNFALSCGTYKSDSEILLQNWCSLISNLFFNKIIRHIWWQFDCLSYFWIGILFRRHSKCLQNAMFFVDLLSNKYSFIIFKKKKKKKLKSRKDLNEWYEFGLFILWKIEFCYRQSLNLWEIRFFVEFLMFFRWKSLMKWKIRTRLVYDKKAMIWHFCKSYSLFSRFKCIIFMLDIFFHFWKLNNIYFKKPELFCYKNLYKYYN